MFPGITCSSVSCCCLLFVPFPGLMCLPPHTEGVPKGARWFVGRVCRCLILFVITCLRVLLEVGLDLVKHTTEHLCRFQS